MNWVWHHGGGGVTYLCDWGLSVFEGTRRPTVTIIWHGPMAKFVYFGWGKWAKHWNWK